MQAKLTLRIDDVLIKKVKKISKQKGKSVSQIFAEYIFLLDKQTDKKLAALPPLTQRLKGILKNKNISQKDYKQYLEDKYL